MATVAQLDADLAIAIAALPSSPTRFARDLDPESERIAVGATRFALRTTQITVDEGSDANQSRQVAGVTLRLAHSLADPTDERAYTTGVQLDDQALVASSAWWRGIASVHEIVEGPEVEELPERIGSVVHYQVEATVVVV